MFEKLFQKVSHKISNKRRIEREAYSISLDDISESALLFSQGLAGDNKIFIKPYDRDLAVVLGDNVLLPKSVSFFSDLQLNRDLLLHQALAAGAVRGLDLKSQFPGVSKTIERCAEIILHQKVLRDFIDQKYPKYREWSDPILKKFEREYSLKKGRSRSDLICERLTTALRENHIEPSEDPKVTKARIENFFTAKMRQNLGIMPSFPLLALAPWCELLREAEILSGTSNPNRQKKTSTTTEVKSRNPSEVEVIDLDKEAKKDNPVFHSFEKLETADEYQGGYRTPDGTDQLEDHQNALDELDLKYVTRGGESAESIYQSDISDLVATDGKSDSQMIPHPECISLPEWDYKRNDLKPNYCQLFLNETTFEVKPTVEGLSPWYEALLDANQADLQRWKRFLESLINKRQWVDRQWDGSEISIDAYVRYLSDFKSSGQGDPRIYTRSVNALREISTLVLIDQSMSTDSWVMNRRVLDVELESIAMMSYLFKDFHEPVAVAGTYSESRHHCSFQLYKNFSENWNSFLSVAPSIQPQGYTRLGPGIRHATELLVKTGAKQKLLILLTDGKPTDYDRYEGRYGIEDIRHAHLEANQLGVQIRALAVEKEAKNYFPQLFGKNEYQIIQNPSRFPEALFKIYLDACQQR